MTQAGALPHHGPLHVQIDWFIRLRWLAALAVVIGAWFDIRWLGWYEHSRKIMLVGVAIAVSNGLIWWVLRSVHSGKPNRRFFEILGCAQLLLDLICLTILIVWTGGLNSPLTPFYVLHMVFASLLLPRMLAYACAVVAIGIYLSALSMSGILPTIRADWLMFAGRAMALLATVYLANHITRNLRLQRRRLVKQNRRIRAMTGQLKRHQKALIQQEKMVALGQMAAGVTHEIANPLASMDSLLQLMQRKPERLRPEAVTTLREQIDRINQIIHQMKKFAHPDDAELQTVELNEVVEQALHMLQFDKRMRETKVERHLAPQAGRLSLFPQALQQVLVNLFINAFDAMSQTPDPVLIVRTDRRDAWCIVEVTDNGSGVADEHMGRLFEPFFTTKPVGKGTGLGLSISYSLIQKQGGSITVKTRLGQGSSFTVRLPTRNDASRGRKSDGGPVAVSEKPSS